MHLLPMRALVGFVFEGRAIDAGALIHASPTAAAALRYQRKAEFTTAPPPDAPTRRRTYRRRDLRAES